MCTPSQLGVHSGQTIRGCLCDYLLAWAVIVHRVVNILLEHQTPVAKLRRFREPTLHCRRGLHVCFGRIFSKNGRSASHVRSVLGYNLILVLLQSATDFEPSHAKVTNVTKHSLNILSHEQVTNKSWNRTLDRSPSQATVGEGRRWHQWIHRIGSVSGCDGARGRPWPCCSCNHKQMMGQDCRPLSTFPWKVDHK